MQHEYAVKFNTCVFNLFQYGIKLHDTLKRSLKNGEEIDLNSSVIDYKKTAEETGFSSDMLNKEISINLIELSQEGQRHHYLYFLLKLYRRILIYNKIAQPQYMEVQSLWENANSMDANFYTELQKNTINECYWNFFQIKEYSHLLKLAIIHEFGISIERWDEIMTPIEKNANLPPIKYIIDNLVLEKETITTTIKLNWKGQKNQLYSVLRQLKENDLITHSYNFLADFLIQNVSGFEHTAKETIEKELKKKSPLPKDKRVKLDLDTED